MRILIAATKSPDPSSDGGRLVLQQTLLGLAAAGHELIAVSPRQEAEDDSRIAPDSGLPYRQVHVAVPGRSRAHTVLSALAGTRSLSVSRHEHAVVRAAVAELIASWRPDVVHAEQLQAFANCMPALVHGVPVVLRMQNVESDLRAQESRARARPWLRLEAHRLRRDEHDAMQRAARTIALTDADASDLQRIAPARPVAAVAPPFPAQLPAAAPIDGDPALVLAGSAGWWPNADGERWLLREVWPRLRARLPLAVLHVFGGDGRDASDGVRRLPAPVDSQAAFAHNAIALVPLRVASGIRLRVLEAWARGLPVVATAAAARGLEVASGRELLLASTPDAFVEAVANLHADAALRASLAEGGRAYLRSRHDPKTQARRLATLYAEAAAQQ